MYDDNTDIGTNGEPKVELQYRTGNFSPSLLVINFKKGSIIKGSLTGGWGDYADNHTSKGKGGMGITYSVQWNYLF